MARCGTKWNNATPDKAAAVKNSRNAQNIYKLRQFVSFAVFYNLDVLVSVFF